ncbi:Hypothetical protein R9X50_00326900 [Acrodontium crateriforme]|uniref:Clock-controlled protein 6 n=1 Tax=Acrodontium crateriforme TaxID=150365 RepID=A0AAQ3M409_9PEZI|nr:Hypothetical protein R9X50_00326900 [Acrodontium crateriforme]
MQFTTTVVAMAGLAAASWAPSYNSSSAAAVYTTEVVTAYTTYCPESTEITHGTKTYTATASETLTITDCPCTLTKPVSTASVYTSVAPPYPSSNVTSTTYCPTGTAAPTTSAATSTGVPIHNAAGKVGAAGAGMMALVGLVAAL